MRGPQCPDLVFVWSGSVQGRSLLPASLPFQGWRGSNNHGLGRVLWISAVTKHLKFSPGQRFSLFHSKKPQTKQKAKKRKDLTARREQQRRGITKEQGQEDGCTALPVVQEGKPLLSSHKKPDSSVFQLFKHHVNFPMSNLQVQLGTEVQTQPSSEPVGLVLPPLSRIKAHKQSFFCCCKSIL